MQNAERPTQRTGCCDATPKPTSGAHNQDGSDKRHDAPDLAQTDDVDADALLDHLELGHRCQLARREMRGESDATQRDDLTIDAQDAVAGRDEQHQLAASGERWATRDTNAARAPSAIQIAIDVVPFELHLFGERAENKCQRRRTRQRDAPAPSAVPRARCRRSPSSWRRPSAQCSASSMRPTPATRSRCSRQTETRAVATAEAR